jgi:hypothetical protein
MDESTEVTMTIESLAIFMCSAVAIQQLDEPLDVELYRKVIHANWRKYLPQAISGVEHMLLAEKLESKTGVQ